MPDIKKREIVKGIIKKIDKSATLVQKTKDNVVSIKEKGKENINTDDKNTNEFAINKMTNAGKVIIDSSSKVRKRGNESVRVTRENIGKTKQKAKSIKNKLAEKKKVKDSLKVIKNSKKIKKKATKKVANESIKASRKAVRLARNSAKIVYQSLKFTMKVTVSSIKAIIASTKALISAIIAGGWIAIVVIIVICLIGLLVSSVYGIFFSSEDIGNNIKMSDCINELNIEMDNKIREIENNTPHDEIIIESNKAEWKDILAIYTIKVSNDNKNEVVTIDNNKKIILRQIFWDMNNISSEVITEVYNEDTSIDYLGVRKENIEKRVLHIRINSKTIDEMKVQYNFNKSQMNQLLELTSDKNLTLWNYAIYGNYGSSGKAENWKQKGESWSNIKIGNTNKTIGDIGCLVTSISILIQKSGVSTNGIVPFNPGTFVQALNNIYGFDSNGSLLYKPISQLIPNFTYTGRVDLSGKSKVDKLNEIKRYSESGYYIAIKVIDTDTAQHWVALDEIKNDTIIMSDPGSRSVDMWKEYDWYNTTQFVYFKIN